MDTSRKVFISYKYKDSDVHSSPIKEYSLSEDTDFEYTPRHYVNKIADMIGEDHIYKGEDDGIDLSHLSDDSIDSKLKERIFDSSVTVVLISPNMFNRFEAEEDQWIPNEISYSLRDKTRGDKTSRANGILAVTLPDYNGSYDYAVIHKPCGVRSWQTQTFFKIIGSNMFNKNKVTANHCLECHTLHHYGGNHSYIHPVKWSDFITDPNAYIEDAVSRRDTIDDFDVTVLL